MSSGSSSSAGLSYATRSDIETIYGETNVEKWADVDNDADANKITNRVEWALELSQAWVNDRLRFGAYVIPFTDVPALITDVTARNAGVLLYDARRITDEGEDADEISFHRRYVEQTLKQVLAGQIRFDIDVTCTMHPKAITLD